MDKIFSSFITQDFSQPENYYQLIYGYGLSLLVASICFGMSFIYLASRRLKPSSALKLHLVLMVIFLSTSYLSSKFLSLFPQNIFKQEVNPLKYNFSFVTGYILTLAILICYLLIKKKHLLLFRILDFILLCSLPAFIMMSIILLGFNHSLGLPMSEELINLHPFLTLFFSYFQDKHPIHIYYLINNVALLSVFGIGYSFFRKPGSYFLLTSPFLLLFTLVIDFFRNDLQDYTHIFTYHQFVIFCLSPLMIILFITLAVARIKFFKKKKFKINIKPCLTLYKFWKQILSTKQFRCLLWDSVLILLLLLFIFMIYDSKNWQKNWKQSTQTKKQDWFTLTTSFKPTITVNIPTKKLHFKDKTYTIAVGKFEAQTPIGIGNVVDKRKKIQFIYTEGIKKGKLIEYFHDLKGRLKRMPYDKMRGLGLKINGFTDYVIHSTTEDWNLQKDVSSGCLRLRIMDMLELYELVEIKTPIVIDYILCEVKDDYLYIYKDIYKLNHCFFDQKKMDFITYAYNEVYEKTNQRLMINKFITTLKNSDFDNDIMKIPLKEIVQ